ncbi:hypothetical protein FOZ62_006969, partial [Perkinsus olseni]
MTSTTVMSRAAAANLRGGANRHLPPIVRVLEDLRRLRRVGATVQPEVVANLLFEATEPKTLTAYTPRQLTELAFSIVVVLGRGSPGDAQDSMEQWLVPVGDEIMRRGAQGFYSKDIGAALETFAPRLPSHPVSRMLAHRGVSLRSSMSCSDLCTVLWSRSLLVSRTDDAGLISDVENIIQEMHRKGFHNLPTLPALFRLLKGIASLPSMTPSIDTAVDALATSLSQQEGLLRDQLQSKQVNFLLYALTESRGAPTGTWGGRKKFLQVMLPIVANHINDGKLSRDTAVSCLRAYARSCKKSKTNGEQQQQHGDNSSLGDVDLTRTSQELLARCSPWILEVLSEAHTLPVTWLTNLLFVYSSSSETCYSPNTEATPVVLSKVVTMLE